MNEFAYNALRTQAAYIDLAGRGNIRVAGEDRARLLHAMTTNHIEQLMPGTGCYAFFLTAQGRILADANIFCLPDHLLLDTELETRDKVRDHLDKFIIADDVVLEDFTNSTAVINVEGPGSPDILKRLGGPAAHLPYTIAEWQHGTVAHVSTTGAPGYSIMIPSEDKAALIAELGTLGVPEAKSVETEAVRLEYGKPRYGVDFSEANIPQETQLLQAIHTSKGCYLGQEIVERVRSRGHVNKLLVQLEIDSPVPPANGTKVLAGDAPSGDITSAAFIPALGTSLAFAIVRAEALQSMLTVDGVSARVRRAAK